MYAAFGETTGSYAIESDLTSRKMTLRRLPRHLEYLTRSLLHHEQRAGHFTLVQTCSASVKCRAPDSRPQLWMRFASATVTGHLLDTPALPAMIDAAIISNCASEHECVFRLPVGALVAAREQVESLYLRPSTKYQSIELAFR